MGWVLSRVRRRASAGGQLEHPSEVKSSTRIGVGDCADAGTSAENMAARVSRRRSDKVDIALEIRGNKGSYTTNHSFWDVAPENSTLLAHGTSRFLSPRRGPE
jgi:hypothetical protein